MLFDRLKAEELNLAEGENHSILLTEFGLENISKLEKEYRCKFSTDLVNSKLKVLCKPHIKNLLEKEINTKLTTDCTYKISLHQKAFKYLQNHKDKYIDIIKTLTHIDFEDITKTLILVGKMY